MGSWFTHKEKIRLMTLDQRDIRPHSHDFLEMVYVTKGSAVHTLDKNETTVSKGDYFIVNCGTVHKYSSTSPEFRIINTLFMPEFIDKSLTGCRSFYDILGNYLIRFGGRTLKRNPTDIVYSDDDGSVYSLTQKLQKEFGGKLPGYIELMRCYLIEIIVKTMRSLGSEDARVLYSDYSKYVIDYVEENYMERVTLGELSARLNLSISYLSKLFRKDTGISFGDYLQKKRMEEACRLLLNTNKKIAEIAELVGYGDVNFFNQVFKKQMNMTPRCFKKLHS